MKNLRVKTASVALLFTLLAVGANAQPQGGGRQGGQGGPQKEHKSPEKIAEIMTDKMDQELELTDAQEKKIYALNLEAAQEAAAQREARKPKAEADKPAERPSKEDMQAKVKEMKEKKDANQKAIMNILTDDQKIGYAKMLAKAEMRRKEQRGGQQGGQRGGQPQMGNQKGGKQQQGGERAEGKKQDGKRPEGGKPEGRPERPQPKAESAE